MAIHRILAAAAIVVSLSACSALPQKPPEPSFNGPVIEVPMDESSAYWVTTPASMVEARRAAVGSSSGCRRVVLGYTIDSTGRVFDVEIIRAWPNRDAVSDLVTMRERYRYEPGPENAGQRPIRTLGTHTAFPRGARCEFPERRQELPPDRDRSMQGGDTP